MKTHTIRIPKIHLSCFVRIYTRLAEAKEVHDHVWVIYVLLMEFEGLFEVRMSILETCENGFPLSVVIVFKVFLH